jgi:hypothetical protein
MYMLLLCQYSGVDQTGRGMTITFYDKKRNMIDPFSPSLMVISNCSIFCFFVCVAHIFLLSFCTLNRADQGDGAQL